MKSKSTSKKPRAQTERAKPRSVQRVVGPNSDALHKLAKALSREVFSTGDEPISKCQRIQFKLGTYPNHEIDGGGLCEDGLVNVLAKALSKHWSNKRGQR